MLAAVATAVTGITVDGGALACSGEVGAVSGSVLFDGTYTGTLSLIVTAHGPNSSFFVPIPGTATEVGVQGGEQRSLQHRRAAGRLG